MNKGGVEMGGASWVCKCERCGGRSIYTFPLGLLPVPLSWCACALIRGMLWLVSPKSKGVGANPSTKLTEAEPLTDALVQGRMTVGVSWDVLRHR
jgi:hypothetical protein